MIKIFKYSFFDINFFLKRKIYPGFKIPSKDLVIDIGSGDKPFWRGDVFFDNLYLEDDQRATNACTVTELGLFIDGDIYHMPFKDKAFDFSFCSHVLEHLQYPELAIKEIMRISKKGYIEVPNGLADSIHPFSTHLQFVYLNDKKLVFIRKDRKELDILTKNGIDYIYLINKIKNPFISMYWENSIEYETINHFQDSPNYTADHEDKESLEDKNRKNNTSSSLYYFFIKIFRKLFLINKNIDIKDLYSNVAEK